MLKKIISVRGILTLLLLLSVAAAAAATYYKIVYWGFSFRPQERTDVWTVDAHVSFKPTGDPIEVSLSTTRISKEYKILSADVVAPGYEVKTDEKNHRVIMKSAARAVKQDVYYRIMIYDNEDTSGKEISDRPADIKVRYDDEQQEEMVKAIWTLANDEEGETKAQKLISVLNKQPLPPEVDSFLPVQKNPQIMAEKIIFLLNAKNIPARVVRGVKLSENKRATSADLMVEAYEGSKWKIYDINTGKSGLPKSFVIFQRGGNSLLDVAGGYDSKVKFSVIKSVVSSFKMAGSRAKYENSRWFDFTIYNLPSLEQNTLKWLMIFPLGILLIVLMRNVIGIQTMGTFTPMLISMSLVKTGFIPGLVCFGLIIGIGLLIRTMLTRLNLLLVPRISSVVICVILIMQMLTILGYQYNFSIASSAVFFPIIITAWIIERASITWEEEGVRNAVRQVVNSVFVAVVTYGVISNEYIRHIMFAFNEWNLVILFVVMLLGTYTGYRLTELKRFAPVAAKEK